MREKDIERKLKLADMLLFRCNIELVVVGGDSKYTAPYAATLCLR